MGTHPIFESDFDCLTDANRPLTLLFKLLHCSPEFEIMVRGQVKSEWKASYFCKVRKLMGKFDKVFVCDADNVTSKQFQDIRQGMRGRGEVLMGKNTMMKRAIRDMVSEKPELEKLVPLIKKNVGFVLTNGDLKEIRDLVERSLSLPPLVRVQSRPWPSPCRRAIRDLVRKRRPFSRRWRFRPRSRVVRLKSPLR